MIKLSLVIFVFILARQIEAKAFSENTIVVLSAVDTSVGFTKLTELREYSVDGDLVQAVPIPEGYVTRDGGMRMGLDQNTQTLATPVFQGAEGANSVTGMPRCVLTMNYLGNVLDNTTITAAQDQIWGAVTVNGQDLWATAYVSLPYTTRGSTSTIVDNVSNYPADGFSPYTYVQVVVHV